MVKATEKKDADIPDWLDKELFVNLVQRDFEDYKSIKEFKVGPCSGNGENYTTLLLRAEIIVELNDGSLKTTSYIVKALPTTVTRDMVTEWKIFDKENNTYATYLPEFEQMYRDANKEVTFGAKYYKPTDPEFKEEVVIMEDLGNRGFKNVKRQDGFDMAHTKAALEKLALFHAASAVRYERSGAYPSIYDRDLCSTKDNFKDFRDNLAKTFIKYLPLYDAAYLESALRTYTSLVPDMFQVHAPKFDNEFRVLNHGDAWCNNIMFQYDEAGCISETYLVDLQMSRYCSPAQDLIYVLISSVNFDLKLSKFDYFIRYYHEKLLENLKLLQYTKPLPTLRSLHKSIYDHGDWVYALITVLLPLVLIDPNENANIDTLMDGEGGDKFRNSMFENPRMVKQLKELLPWAYNRGFFDYDKK